MTSRNTTAGPAAQHAAGLLSALLVFSAFLLSACATDGKQEAVSCQTTADCPLGEVCLDGSCAAAECRTEAQCAADHDCVNGRCMAPDADTGVDAGDDTDTGGDTGGDTVADTDDADTQADTDADEVVEQDADTSDEPEVVDFGALEVIATTPSNGDVSVSTVAEPIIYFNQPLAPQTLIAGSTIRTLSHSGGVVPRSLVYNPADWSVTLAPDVPGTQLQPATPYTVQVRDQVRSESGETLASWYEFQFVTAAPGGRENHETLARAYAPVVMQQVNDPAIDTFAELGFDGDTDPGNNLDNASGAHPGYTYYIVSETETHWFIGYTFYYPGVRLNTVTTAEHDSWTAMVVVEKTASSLGEFRAVFTYYLDVSNAWLAPSAWYGEGRDIGENEEDIAGRFLQAALENDRNITVFVEGERHAPCPLGANSTEIGCVQSVGGNAPFDNDVTGLTYREGPFAQVMGQSADDALEYGLFDVTNEIWLKRYLTDGNDLTDLPVRFASDFEYSPRDSRPGDGIKLPERLVSEPDVTADHTLLPFAYEAPPIQEPGMWYVDPAYVASEHLSFPETFSTDYCYNLFLGIDRRGETGCE